MQENVIVTLFEGGVPKHPSTQATMVWSIDAANFVLPHHHHRLYLAPAVQRNMVTKYKVSGFVLDQVLGSTAILP